MTDWAEQCFMDSEILKQAYKKKAEQREKLRKELMEKIPAALDSLSHEAAFKEAYIFGSVTQKNQFSEQSDIDIAFAGLDRDKLFFAVSFMSNKLGRDVNAVHIEDIHFRNKIMGEGIRWKRN